MKLPGSMLNILGENDLSQRTLLCFLRYD